MSKKKAIDWRTATFEEMREAEVPWFETMDELKEFIGSVTTERTHDYNTSALAMSLAAVAAFRFVAGLLGTTGFQAGCADLDFLRRTRGLKGPFRILDYENLLFPQRRGSKDFPSRQDLMKDPHVAEWLGKEAEKRLKEKVEEIELEDGTVIQLPAASIRQHWRFLVENGKLVKKAKEEA